MDYPVLVNEKQQSNEDLELSLSDNDEKNPLCDDQDKSLELDEWNELSVPKPVIKALVDLKFSQPTPIQRETLPAAINGHADILGAAETGSGKTLAFGIPIGQFWRL